MMPTDPTPDDLSDLARLKAAGFACRTGTTATGAPAVEWYHADTGQRGTVEELATVLGVTSKPHWVAPRLLAAGDIELGEQLRDAHKQKKPFVRLTYGNGIAGQDYYLLAYGQVYRLNDQATCGGPADERAARERARAILNEKHPTASVDLDAMEFVWNGTL